MTLVEKDWQEIAEQFNNDGLEAYDLGNYEEAVSLYNQAIDLESKGIKDIEVCYFNRGRAYFKLENYQKAIGDYTKAIGISPQSKYYSERAVAYEMIGDSGNAILDNILIYVTYRLLIPSSVIALLYVLHHENTCRYLRLFY